MLLIGFIFAFSIFTLSLIYIISKRMRKKRLKQTTLSEKIETLNKSLSKMGYAYDSTQDSFYSLKDGWHKEFGYSSLYNYVSPSLGIITDCESISFEYENKLWLIEFRKGQYGVAIGCEIGVYVAEKKEKTQNNDLMNYFYAVDESEYPSISLSLWRGRHLLFSRKDYHWLMSGFILGQYAKPEELKMNIEISFQDNEQCASFYESMIKLGYQSDNCLMNERTVWITFKSPKSKQPSSRNGLHTKFKQKQNKYYCSLYNRITKDFNTSVEKLEVVSHKSPLFYYRIYRFVLSKRRYVAFLRIK